MLHFETYEEHEKHLPSVGKFIIAQFDTDSIVVYQGFKDSIARYAMGHQRFGGDDYDFNRITWLKPSFLWMMYYSGWAKHEDQENVLAIRISKAGFDQILHYAVMSTFHKDLYPDAKTWERRLLDSDIRLQWEIYHDLFGNKTERMAARVGIAGEARQRFNEEWIMSIEDITPYVREQQQLLRSGKPEKIRVPRERAYAPDDLTILRKIDATTISL